MPIFCMAFALQFAIPIFTRDATIELAQGEARLLEDSDVTAALMLATIGIAALQVGYYAFQRSPLKKAVPVAQLPLNKSKAIICCLLLGVVLPLAGQGGQAGVDGALDFAALFLLGNDRRRLIILGGARPAGRLTVCAR